MNVVDAGCVVHAAGRRRHRRRPAERGAPGCESGSGAGVAARRGAGVTVGPIQRNGTSAPIGGYVALRPRRLAWRSGAAEVETELVVGGAIIAGGASRPRSLRRHIAHDRTALGTVGVPPPSYDPARTARPTAAGKARVPVRSCVGDIEACEHRRRYWPVQCAPIDPQPQSATGASPERRQCIGLEVLLRSTLTALLG